MRFDEKELLGFVEEIDKQYSEKDVPIQKRQLNAIMAFGDRYDVPVPLTTSVIHKYGVAGPEAELAYVSDFISDWYKTRYGELNKQDFTIGKTIIVVSGNYFLLKIPTVLSNSLNVTWDPAGPMRPEKSLSISKPVNLPIFIEGITPEIVENAADSEIKEAIEHFSNCLLIFDFLKNTRKHNKYINALCSDLVESVNCQTNQSPSFGASKWASLQATEKYIKATLENNGKTFPKTHNLEKLNSLLNESENQLNFLVERIQCDAGVRYGETPVSRNEAFDAHSATLEYIFKTAPQHWMDTF